MNRHHARGLIWIGLIGAGSGIASCGDSTSPGELVATVTVAPDAATLAAGDTLRLRATPRNPSGQAIENRRASWSSDDTTVARVDSAGLVTGIAEGDATITATVAGRSGSAEVTVTPAAVAEVTLTPGAATIEVGRSVQLLATPRDAAGRALADREVAWTSSDTTVVAVDASGLVRGRKEGAADVTATSEGVEGAARITVIPRPVAAIEVRPDTAAILESTMIQLVATLTDSDGDTIRDGRPIDWSSSDTVVARVDTTGRVTGRSAGTAAISAHADGQADTARIAVLPPVTYAEIDGGVMHTCGLTAGAVVYCWGDGGNGQLGNGASQTQSAPVQVAGGLAFDRIQAGGRHSCGLTMSGTAFCWGDNDWGQLGDGNGGSFVQETEPVAVLGGLEFATLSTGTLHTCAIESDGDAYCWGANVSGQLGDGTTADRDVPVPVAGGLTFSTISAGGQHACGLTPAGAAYCWGSNGFGQLGDGTITARETPVAVAGGLSFATIFAGPEHTCATTTDDLAYCWGRNTRGQLGDGSTVGSDQPVAVGGGLSFVQVALGFAHTCGITPTGSAYCWGWGERGQLGDGAAQDAALPVAVAGDMTFDRITGGSFHSCGIVSGGTAYCWGFNSTGQLGDGTTETRSTPVRVLGQPE